MLSKKVVLSFLSFFLAAGLSFSSSSAAPVKHHHKDAQPEILITKLNNSLSDQRSDELMHFCPIHGELMKGAFCKMKIADLNKPDSAHEEIEECFISIDEGGLPSGSVSFVYQLDHKFVEANVSDNSLIVPSWIFTLSELKGSSDAYSNTPEKPPKYLS